MFTLDQIQSAHSKVKSGADFPAFIQDLKSLCVESYDTFVTDGHTHYYGAKDFVNTTPAKFDPLRIAETPNTEQFKAGLKAHQQGKTSYPEFISMCAENGIEKWTVRMDRMTCTYNDLEGNEVLVEDIPDLN